MPDATQPAKLLRSLRALVDGAVLWLLAGTLALLPFEFVLPDDLVVQGYTLTTLEHVGLVALGAWLVSLVVGRRLPRLPVAVALALAVLLAVGLASALLVDGLRDQALDAAGHAVAGGLLLVAVADTAQRQRTQSLLAAALVTGATLSALVGLAVFAVPSLGAALGTLDFTAAGARRLAGTLDYPNSAAMYYEAAALLAIGLAVALRQTVLRAAFGAAAVVLLAAMVLTLSRGAIVGMAAGLLVLTALALAHVGDWRRRAWLGAGIGALLLGAVALPLALGRSDGAVANPAPGIYEASYEAPRTGALIDATMVVPVTVTNEGTIPWNADGSERYRLGYHWLTPDARRLIGDGRELATIGPLGPGETTVVNATVNALPPALNHVVAWDVVVPGQLWFSQHDVPVATTVIASIGLPAEPVPPPAVPASLDLYRDIELPPTRDELWRAAAAMTVERPLLGHGPGTFQLRYGPYLGRSDFDTDIHANNTYLEISATSGILGLACFLVLVAVVVLPLLRRLVRAGAGPKPARAEALLGAALVGAVAAFLAHGVVDYFVGFNPTGGLFWAILGLIVATGRSRT